MRSGEASIRLGVTMDNVGVARRFVARTFGDRVPDHVIDDLVLATSELVTNALEHGRSAAVEVRAHVTDHEATVTVVSRGGQGVVLDPATWRPAAADHLSGRGLGIVNAVADNVDVDRADADLAITVRRRFDRVADSAPPDAL